MFDFQEKRRIRQIVYSRFFIGAIFLIGILIANSAYNRYTVEREMAVKRDSKLQELEELRVRAAALESNIEHLENDRGIEEELRSRFDVVKEGEQVVVILEDPEAEKLQAKSPPSSLSPQHKKSFWSSFKGMFAGSDE